jgi:predicted porin
MKKSLLAVAAMTAFAGAAQAQSSVTVYGILDVGFIGANTTSSTSAPKNGAAATTKTTGNQFGNSAEQTSRLGFKGSEDLGNGTQAVFTVEFALAPTDTVLSGNPASTGSTGGTTNGGLQNRQTFVGLHKNGIGQAAIGTQYTGVHTAVGATDPGQQNNMMGNVIYASSAGGVTNGYSTAQGTTIGYTVRMDNALTFQSDAISGFRANAMAVLNNKNANQTVWTGVATGGVAVGDTQGGQTNTNGWGLGADYTWNNLFVTAQYQAFKQFTTATGTPSQPFTVAGAGLIAITPTVTGSTGTGSASVPLTQGLNIQDNQVYAGATYDFGILKAYANYLTRTATSTSNSSTYLKRSAEQIGVRSYVTPTIEAWASAGLGRYSAYGLNQPTANFNAWQLGSNYWMSKRTNLYAIYGATTTSTYAPTATTTASNSGQNYAVGVRHTF